MKKTIRIFTVVLLVSLGISALFGGGAFIIDPSGEIIHMPISHLELTPFESFLLPGLILFLFNGVSGIVIAVFVIKMNRFAPDLVILQGLVLAVWILVQVNMIRSTSVLHYICFIIGILLIISGVILHGKTRTAAK